MEALKFPTDVIGEPVAVTTLTVPLDKGVFLKRSQYMPAGMPSMDAPESGSAERTTVLLPPTGEMLTWTMSSADIELMEMLPAVSVFSREPLPLAHTDWK